MKKDLLALAAQLKDLPLSRDSMKVYRDAAVENLEKLAEEVDKYKLVFLQPTGISSKEGFGRI